MNRELWLRLILIIFMLIFTFVLIMVIGILIYLSDFNFVNFGKEVFNKIIMRF